MGALTFLVPRPGLLSPLLRTRHSRTPVLSRCLARSTPEPSLRARPSSLLGAGCRVPPPVAALPAAIWRQGLRQVSREPHWEGAGGSQGATGSPGQWLGVVGRPSLSRQLPGHSLGTEDACHRRARQVYPGGPGPAGWPRPGGPEEIWQQVGHLGLLGFGEPQALP